MGNVTLYVGFHVSDDDLDQLQLVVINTVGLRVLAGLIVLQELFDRALGISRKPLR